MLSQAWRDLLDRSMTAPLFISEMSHMYFSMIVFLIFHTVRMQLYRFSRRDETVKYKTYREH